MQENRRRLSLMELYLIKIHVRYQIKKRYKVSLLLYLHHLKNNSLFKQNRNFFKHSSYMY